MFKVRYLDMRHSYRETQKTDYYNINEFLRSKKKITPRIGEGEICMSIKCIVSKFDCRIINILVLKVAVLANYSSIGFEIVNISNRYMKFPQLPAIMRLYNIEWQYKSLQEWHGCCKKRQHSIGDTMHSKKCSYLAN